MEMEWLNQVIACTGIGLMLVITVSGWRIVAAIDRMTQAIKNAAFHGRVI